MCVFQQRFDFFFSISVFLVYVVLALSDYSYPVVGIILEWICLIQFGFNFNFVSICATLPICESSDNKHSLVTSVNLKGCVYNCEQLEVRKCLIP